jgi:hypothetical protein
VSVIEAWWNNEECRIEDGIYFVDDSYVPLTGFLPALPRRPVQDLITVRPDYCASLNVGDPLVELSSLLVFGGDGSWEGEGFLALLRGNDRTLVWVLHSARSGAFVSADLDGEILVAQSIDYPNSYHWRIPMDSPWELEVSCHEA